MISILVTISAPHLLTHSLGVGWSSLQLATVASPEQSCRTTGHFTCEPTPPWPCWPLSTASSSLAHKSVACFRFPHSHADPRRNSILISGCPPFYFWASVLSPHVKSPKSHEIIPQESR
ncbi:hypothetical protein K493DRAFT_105284 [Basidiobolus meristosporus CBS 931.73]|uniref:Uncharacterized protein n=1 Tax=Basidiobolus meristosporus CBS 931.73 TaxID=1314790 RepID=A0A1Y1WVM1_9FUNG|nr:hypothetical protein K493DRAFT_105284 [Basidiobolus meristosporus CBS 931.73]|eukprot:ORX77611.1 hypothetical protein K493DRAFT_105284 [Basidiobolus meristosporus CBS 931.73]